MKQKETELYNLLIPSVEGLGLELWGLEFFAQGKYTTMRIYIDKPGGVTLDELGEASKQLNAVLDVEEPVRGGYQLEVSSPGIERKLFFPTQYGRYIGCEIRVVTYQPVDGQRKFNGVLQSASTEHVVLSIDKQEKVLPMEQIEKAIVVSEIDHDE